MRTAVTFHRHPRIAHKGHIPLGGIFRAERHFLLFKDQLAESGRRKTKKISVENDRNSAPIYVRFIFPAKEPWFWSTMNASFSSFIH